MFRFYNLLILLLPICALAAPTPRPIVLRGGSSFTTNIIGLDYTIPSSGGSSQTNWSLSAITNGGKLNLISTNFGGQLTNLNGAAITGVVSYINLPSSLASFSTNNGANLTNIPYAGVKGQLWGTNAVDGSITNVNGVGVLIMSIFPDGSFSTVLGNFSVSAGGDVVGENFSGEGAGLTSLNASQLTSGTVASARLATTASASPGSPMVTFAGTNRWHENVWMDLDGTIHWGSDAGSLNADGSISGFISGANITSGIIPADRVVNRGSALLTNMTTTSTVLANLGMNSVINVTSGHYYEITFILYFSDGLAADGLKVDFGGGGASATTFRAHGNVYGTVSGFGVQTTSLTGTISGASVSTDNEELEVHCFLKPSSTGTFLPRFAKNANAAGSTLTIFAGSNVVINELPQ